jgi:hypothetical protein
MGNTARFLRYQNVVPYPTTGDGKQWLAYAELDFRRPAVEATTGTAGLSLDRLPDQGREGFTHGPTVVSGALSFYDPRREAQWADKSPYETLDGSVKPLKSLAEFEPWARSVITRPTIDPNESCARIQNLGDPRLSRIASLLMQLAAQARGSTCGAFVVDEPREEWQSALPLLHPLGLATYVVDATQYRGLGEHEWFGDGSAHLHDIYNSIAVSDKAAGERKAVITIVQMTTPLYQPYGAKERAEVHAKVAAEWNKANPRQLAVTASPDGDVFMRTGGSRDPFHFLISYDARILGYLRARSSTLEPLMLDALRQFDATLRLVHSVITENRLLTRNPPDPTGPTANGGWFTS